MGSNAQAFIFRRGFSMEKFKTKIPRFGEGFYIYLINYSSSVSVGVAVLRELKSVPMVKTAS